ncbi:MAG TPA: hypothetical protein PK804_02565 [Candidatus Dojkabacteria bacterium]|nr:hypothetical protein [Candidatus Dojkabacteria bacterium]HQC39511.1 hypothetical protein [Candidatus Dojkabacteria bacterium]
MDSVKDILSQLKTNIPQEKKKDSQQELFDVNLLQTNPKKIFGDKGKYVTTEYQRYGLRIAGKLDDKKRITMYIKWAKTKPRAILETALRFVSDYPNAQNKFKLFMWKVKQLENERQETKQKDTK